MSPRNSKLVVFTLAFTLGLCLGPGASAGDFFSQGNFGLTFFDSSPSCPAKKIPTFESLVPIPAIIDPFEQPFVPIFCRIQARAGSEGVKAVKGKYTSQLIVRHNDTGMLESLDIDNGSFRTKKTGIAEFDFEIPTEIFADGFESGDVSAWSYTRADFTNRKRVDSTSLECGKVASKED